MTANTPFVERTKTSLREELLDAATELLIRHGYSGLRMVDVATAVGVSRQTVYNEFGGKPALTEAVALRTLVEFQDGITRIHREAPDALAAIRGSVAYTVRHARENRLVAAIIGTPEAEDLLPLLTTKGAPVLHASIEHVRGELRTRAPALPAEQAALLAETVVRLAISYLLLPEGDPEHAADSVCAVVAPALRQYTPI